MQLKYLLFKTTVNATQGKIGVKGGVGGKPDPEI